MLNVTIRQLQVFSAVARRLSFARVAEELHLSPPAVSMQIKQLESQLGLAVFERGASTLRLTLAGEFFLVHSRKVLAALKEAEDLVARMRRVETGRLQLGMLSTAKYFLPQLLTEFLREHPGVDVTLVEGNREQLIGSVQRNEVDLAVMGRAPGELEARAEAFGVHPLGIVAAASHPLASAEQVTRERLGSEPFIIREVGSGARSAMEAYFREQHIRPPVLMQMASNETIKQAVIAGMGLAFLSLHTVGNELREGRLRVLPASGLPILRNWHVVHRRARQLSPAAEALRYFLIERGEDFLASHFASLESLLRTTGHDGQKKIKPLAKAGAARRQRVPIKPRK